MDEALDLIEEIARQCDDASRLFSTDPIAGQVKALTTAVDVIARSWSGSAIGYHAALYLPGFRDPYPGERFDPEWGQNHHIMSGASGRWESFSDGAVREEILGRSGIATDDAIEQAGKQAPAGGDTAGAPLAVGAVLVPAVPQLGGTQRLRVSTSPRALCSTYREEPTGGGLELTTSAAPENADGHGNAEWQWDAKSFGKVTITCDAHKHLGSILLPYQIRS